MAQEQQPQKPANNSLAHSFSGGMIQDMLAEFVKTDHYRYARNATNVLPDGMVGGLSTEPATVKCTNIPYVLIGAIPLNGSEWELFFTDDTNHEIGIFNEDTCTYTTLTGNQRCLNFNKRNLISGDARRGFDCGFNTYWADGARNPDRTMNTAKVPFIQIDTTPGGPCHTFVDTTDLDCEALRLQPVFTIPCMTLAKSTNSGTLLNGSYQVTIAFAANSIRCTDYLTPSNVMSIWAHSGQAGAVTLKISGIDEDTKRHFSEMEVVVISQVNGQAQAKRLGFYSTREEVIYIDNINPELITVPLALIPVSNPAIEKSDMIAGISNYLLRSGVYTQPDFNYQPLANQIKAWWVAVDYPEDYYQKGGLNGFPMNVGHMRGEVYAPFIRWCYTTGGKSAAYPLSCELGQGTFALGGPTVGDGSTTKAHGKFICYESEEKYPDNQIDVWGPLCGQKIRWFRFPDAASTFGTGGIPQEGLGGGPVLSHFSRPFATSTGGTSNSIRVMGWYFDNIQAPVDNLGNIIPNIQGYEILRATRDGHMSVLAKGMINNMRSYTVPGSNVEGLYQNYPYNDLNPDYFLTSDKALIEEGGLQQGGSPLTGFREDVFSFHSPDTVFNKPFLGSGALRVTMGLGGVSTGHFITPWEHPKFRILTNFDFIIVDILALLVPLTSIVGAIAGYPVSTVLASKEDLPMTQPLGAGDSMGMIAGTSAPYLFNYAFNILMAIALAPLQALVVQQQLLNVLKGLIPARQFATQYNSYGRYNSPRTLAAPAAIVEDILDYQYIRGYMQYFAGASVNNLYRNNFVGIQIKNKIPSTNNEVSRYLLSDISGDKDWKEVFPNPTPTPPPFANILYSYYAAYTVPQIAQYGQIDSNKLVPVSCMQQVNILGGPFTSPIIFGGDTYINRYTEKNPFFYFNDWLKGQPNDVEYDYRNYVNVPYPRYWVDNTNVYYDFLALADQNRRLDNRVSSVLYVKSGNFYLFNNGCRDFFVESTVNVGYRDWEDLPSQQFYDPYGSSKEFIDIMFRSDIINSDILYKYDYSLSANRFVNQYISWAQVLRRDYDPALAFTCFAYYPRRIHYSLPQEEEQFKDNWRLFLANNYTNFSSKVTAIRDIGKTGAIFLQETEGPQVILGIESMPSSSGTDFSIGTGSLFRQGLTSLVNVDNSYQYGSCQSRMGVINTPHGIFWISQKAGKVFQYGGGNLEDITKLGMHYWFSLYLPSQLLKQIPNFEFQDNPVIGIGCQLVWDNVNELLYICKKDFKAKSSITLVSQTISSTTGGTETKWGFYTTYGGKLKFVEVKIGDPTYFEDASWTISYDPKEKKFVSFHDWHPSYTMGTKNHFLSTIPTTGPNILWRHNLRTDLFCNYYDKGYPFAVEPVVAGQGMDYTVENIEYLMEAYNYKANQYDKYNQFDSGFSRVLVNNPEQSTLWMDLQLQPWNDPFASLAFPNISVSGTQNSLYSKVENKYRLGDIKDYTADRGATIQTGSLTTVQAIITEPNGYVFTVNNVYTEPNKAATEKKKMRHYNNRIYLQRTIVGNNSMTIRMLSVNTTRSYR